MQSNTTRRGSADPLPAAPGTATHPALALVNTRTVRPGGEVDELRDGHAAQHWLTATGLLAPGVAVGAGRAGRLAGLRESVRALLTAFVDGEMPEPAALAEVNAALAAVPCADELHWDAAPPGPRRVPRPVRATAFDAALAGIAGDTVDRLTGPDAATLTACRAPGCIRLYLRTHANRHWCSTRCGDRVRAARHYARARRQR